MSKIIRLGRDEVSMLNPPNEGVVKDMTGKSWDIKRNNNGMIVLKSTQVVHHEFRDGMDLQTFCQWINHQL